VVTSQVLAVSHKTTIKVHSRNLQWGAEGHCSRNL